MGGFQRGVAFACTLRQVGQRASGRSDGRIGVHPCRRSSYKCCPSTSPTEEGFISTDQRYLKDDKHITNDDGTTAVSVEGGVGGRGLCCGSGLARWPQHGCTVSGRKNHPQFCHACVLISFIDTLPPPFPFPLPCVFPPQLFSMVVGQRLITAHVGDSRAVMHNGRQGEAKGGS